MKTFGLLAIPASALSSKELFDQWKSTFDVKYQSPREEALRFDQWMKNKDFVDHHNMLFMSGKKTHTVGMNKFADLSNEEYAHFYLSQVSDLAGPHPPMCTPSSIAANSTAPDSADWRPLGAVTPIKDQGSFLETPSPLFRNNNWSIAHKTGVTSVAGVVLWTKVSLISMISVDL